MLLSTQTREGVGTLLAQTSHFVRAIREGGTAAMRYDGVPNRLSLG